MVAVCDESVGSFRHEENERRKGERAEWELGGGAEKELEKDREKPEKERKQLGSATSRRERTPPAFSRALTGTWC